MSSRNLVRPYFPVPPADYERRYFAELVRSFSVYLEQMQNPGQGRNTTIVLTDLPSTDFGLEPGSLFQQDGFVKITRANVPHATGVVASGGVGTVTVVTP